MPDIVTEAGFAADLLAAYRAPMNWIQFKDYLVQITDLHEDALHIYAAVLVQLTAAVVLRRSLASIIPWLTVFAVLVVNEWLDLTEPGKPFEEWQVLGGLQDLWNTMAVPTILLLLARFAPSLMTNRSRSAAEVERLSGSIETA